MVQPADRDLGEWRVHELEYLSRSRSLSSTQRLGNSLQLHQWPPHIRDLTVESLEVVMEGFPASLFDVD